MLIAKMGLPVEQIVHQTAELKLEESPENIFSRS